MADGGDAQRLSALEKAVNDSASKAGVLWTSFLTLGTYLLIATGSVTHRELFLNSSIKLPVLGVELPVTGYFLVAPILYLIFHFYLLLQLEGLSEKVADYNQVLNETVKPAVDRRRARWRLDDFPFLQFLAGVRERRTGLAGNLQMFISWITVVLFPIVVLLQLQIVFLPYHSEPIIWLQRICLMIDLGMIWFFWHAIGRNLETSRRRRAAVAVLEAAGALLVVIFSLSLATFPGEGMYRNGLAKTVDGLVSLAFRDQAISASKYFFEGKVDGVTGQPGSLFANRIILPDERFPDPTKKIDVPVSLRGRDLRGAVLSRADLSQADFTGATLLEASFLGARLQKTKFGCAADLQLALSEQLRQRAKADSCDEEHATDLRGADFSEAVLHGASFNHANLRGARFARAMMQGAIVDDADLTGAAFTYARLEGASLANANLTATSMFGAQMQGANLDGADLSFGSLLETQLQGATFRGATLANATFRTARLYRAFVNFDDHAGAILIGVNARPVYPKTLMPGSVERNNPDLPQTLDAAGFKTLVVRAQERIQSEEIRQVVVARLQVLDPARKADAKQLVSDQLINSDRAANETIRLARAEAINKLMCEADGAPYIARGFIYNGRILGIQDPRQSEADDPSLRAIATLRGDACPGAVGLVASDFRELTKIERQVLRQKRRDREDSAAAPDDDPDDGDKKDTK
ncbi:pentapeptide repeat-containing protein [Bradyrhizobium sp. CCBAU 51753]|uniref:pentapeptide repeat-containing protein n=1 Tax=Bradyrhizobium sp. CCBAU 51753 TaxID=1325100 RepID=UPI00188D1DE5|nr:pentapeptide repeat-containing protein [Bradyrhizobium sp. CCBAU 51753]QOZ23463.1 hypothetical protein XH93_07245 [Bradyrhizobium sp. CCBAU 51753]